MAILPMKFLVIEFKTTLVMEEGQNMMYMLHRNGKLGIGEVNVCAPFCFKTRNTGSNYWTRFSATMKDEFMVVLRLAVIKNVLLKVSNMS